MSERAPDPAIVSLPAIDDDLIRRTEVRGAVFEDLRRHPRLPSQAICALSTENTYAASGHESPSQEVMLRDLSRGGARVLHGAELFPGEKCTIALPSGAHLRLEIVWCRRLEAGIYASGCRFASERSNEADADAKAE